MHDTYELVMSNYNIELERLKHIHCGCLGFKHGESPEILKLAQINKPTIAYYELNMKF